MDLSVNMLAAFVRVAERLSVTAASQELGLAKSVVSKRLTQLEQGLGASPGAVTRRFTSWKAVQ